MNKTWAVDVTFSNLTYSAATKTKAAKKNILNSISGCFKSGELTGIMGPSGAGKSTLLNILTGFITNGVKGEVSFGAIKKTRKVCSYILQEDHFFPWFTVEESMILAATLKISNKSMTMKQKQVLIENILDTLHLSNAKQTKCSNLSGGQKKRLSIALELIDNPPILFLDEPTTGLDSASSADTVNLLETLSRDGRTIVCTIHQPSASIFHIFSHIYVLDKGYCVFQGAPINTIPFLNSMEIQCPQYHNPADFLLEVITGEHGNYTKQMIEAASDNQWRYDQESLDNKMLSCHNHSRRKSSISSWSSDSSKHIYPPPEWIRLWLLIGRCHIQFYRDWTVTHLKLVLHIFCSILIGLLFGDSGTNATKVISNFGLFLVAIVYLWYTTMMPGVLRFPLEISIIKKETFNSWYKLRTYYLATLITSTPVHIIFSTAFSTITYLLTDQPFELERYMKFAFINIMITIAADAFGVLLGTLANPVNGTFIGAILTCFMLIFSGFLILFEHMPGYMKVISYLSAHRYGFESLVLTVYDNGRDDMLCPPETVYCHLRKADFILKSIGVKGADYNFNVGMLLLQISLLKGLAYFTLRRALRTSS